MTKTEIELLINNHLARNPITITDLLNKTMQIYSYENYIVELSWIKKTFKLIPEFCDDINIYLNRMNKLIEDCLSLNDTALQNRINNARRELCNSSSSIALKAILASSIKNTSECSEQAFIQIYNDLGYDNLRYYIDLSRNPSSLTNYLGSSDKQAVAMHYILYKTDHHSNSKFKRDFTTQNLYTMMSKNITETISEITSEKDDFVTFMNNEKEQYNKWFEESNQQVQQLYNNNKNEYDEFLSNSKNSIEQIKQTYSKKLKVEKPAEFMSEKSKSYMWSSIWWGVATVRL